ncbi:Pre-rRNA-processing protein TSR2-domain-containing protein [Microdochium trichocladiopsis]|uniref:Pre-rRNA-processing protein TSR2-domain-containing protein n=1 Tax=Microdochium trichocladiopsis TaxID=1682393 RepID=A0A9P8YJ27_9PEZI|nr:Pre-rRNA-processing protein TSR2-domain-containing protein [Microdochium trichocladiopsis]KAH7040291.1 Pre-rRNA-processing protein TSR2-domain-containing protein [Microdochium trichocladiopsis]
MASTSQTEPSPEVRQNNFEQGVAITLHLWPALSLAVQNNWGDGDASDKRDWLAGVIVDMFPSFIDLAKKPASTTTTTTNATGTSSTAATGQQSSSSAAALEEPYLEDIETTLLQVMLDEFDVNVDDDTGFETAETIMRARAQCAKGNFDEVNNLRRRWEAGKGKKVVMQQAADADQDTDWESDDDDEDGDSDVDMDEAPALAKAPKEKEEPEVDEDGFTKVTRKKR